MSVIQRIETVEQLDDLMKASTDRPVWILKHSLTCSISASAYREYLQFAAQQASDGAVFALVEIQNARPVSNAIEERTGILHQSPQALLVKRSAVAWHASHGSIRGAALVRASAG